MFSSFPISSRFPPIFSHWPQLCVDIIAIINCSPVCDSARTRARANVYRYPHSQLESLQETQLQPPIRGHTRMHATYTHALLVGFATNVWPICDHQNNIFHSTIYFMAFPLFFKIYTVCVVLHPLFLDFPDCEDPITIRGSSCSFLPVCCL